MVGQMNELHGWMDGWMDTRIFGCRGIPQDGWMVYAAKTTGI